ncbi:hypothetical protein FLX56_21840 [Synechococcus moorigangaii CMS01]|nr:hypothetical protein [Synechococcus moorigangaii CMS01]
MELPAQGNETPVEAPMAPAVRAEEVTVAEPTTTEGSAPVAPPAPVVQSAMANDPESLIVAAVQAASQAAAAAQIDTSAGFASNYLLSAGNRSQRRRPGANMAAFKSMAQTVKR